MKKQFESAVLFRELFRETLEQDRDFVIVTDDPKPELFADELIAQHYPPQSELPLG